VIIALAVVAGLCVGSGVYLWGYHNGYKAGLRR